MTISGVYDSLGTALFKGWVDYEDDSIRAILLTSAYVLDQDNHQSLADISPFELVGTGYSEGGLELPGKAIVTDQPNNKISLVCENLLWENTTWDDVKYLVFYDADADVLLSYVDFEVPQSTTNISFTYLVPTTGILTLTMA